MERRPILATLSGEVYAGNMRLRAAQHLGWTTVPAILDDLTPEEAKARSVRDNLHAGDFQEDDYAALLYELGESGIDLTSLGADSKDIDRLLASVGVGGAEEDAVPDPPAEPITRLGDLWLLGPHRLLCGDSTRREDVERLMNGRRVQMLWTDPPYGVSYVGKTKDALTIINDDAAGIPALLRDAFEQATVALIPGAPFYLARPAGALGVVFLNAVIAAGWRIHEELQWVKDSMVLGHSDYHIKHETIVYGYTAGTGRLGRGGEHWYGDDSQVTVFTIDRPKRSTEHPTGKPVELVSQHLVNSCRAGEAVLDLFIGSGTTLIAAEGLGRGCYGLDVDPVYVDVAVQRWQNLTGQTATRESAEVAA